MGGIIGLIEAVVLMLTTMLLGIILIILIYLFKYHEILTRLSAGHI